MLDHWLTRFPQRRPEVLAVYVVLLDREELKSRLPEGCDPQVLAKTAPIEVIWHCEDIARRFARCARRSAGETIPTRHAGKAPTDAVGQPLDVRVGHAPRDPLSVSSTPKVGRRWCPVEEENYVVDREWLPVGWDRYG